MPDEGAASVRRLAVVCLGPDANDNVVCQEVYALSHNLTSDVLTPRRHLQRAPPMMGSADRGRALIVMAIAALSAVLQPCACDVYMNNPRGSNNKLNEQNNNRQNANRLFDSQNNAAGGYQVLLCRVDALRRLVMCLKMIIQYGR